MKTSSGVRALIVLAVILASALVTQSVFYYRLHRSVAGTRTARVDPIAVVTPSPPPSTSAKADKDDTWDPFGGFGLSNDPFESMRKMQERMDRMFDDTFHRMMGVPALGPMSDDFAFAPQMDLQEQGNNYVVTFDLPGADKNNVSVKIDDRVLTVSGKTEEENDRTDAHHFRRMERSVGRFERSLTLPGPVDSSGMKASYKDGVLTVTVPKAKGETAPRSISIS